MLPNVVIPFSVQFQSKTPKIVCVINSACDILVMQGTLPNKRFWN